MAGFTRHPTHRVALGYESTRDLISTDSPMARNRQFLPVLRHLRDLRRLLARDNHNAEQVNLANQQVIS